MIIAVDFDGTICENRWPNIGAPNKKLINKLIELKELGAKIIYYGPCVQALLLRREIQSEICSRKQ